MFAAQPRTFYSAENVTKLETVTTYLLAKPNLVTTYNVDQCKIVTKLAL